MHMRDVEIAKKRLNEKGLTLSIVKDQQIVFETSGHGISGFLKAIEEFGERLQGASVADKIAGKAVALLCVYARVKEVYATIVSRRARVLLQENGIEIQWNEVVENVLGRDKSEACPYERLAAETTDPEQAYKKLKALHESLDQCR
jgi:hypothetical protein